MRIFKNIINIPKIAIYVAIFVLYPIISAYSQKSEFGIGIGNGAYRGSLTRTPSFITLNPGFTLFYRHNYVGNQFVLRPEITFMNLSYKDSYSSNPLNDSRKSSFSTPLYEFGLMSEYNFLDFRGSNKYMFWSPYLTAGIAGFVYDGGRATNSFGMSIPMGAGMKFVIGKQLNLGFELVARKTFTNDLDGVTNYPSIGLQGGDSNFNDWYYFTNIHLSYTIYKVVCASFGR